MSLVPSDRLARRDHVLTADEEAVYFAAAAKYSVLHDVARVMISMGLRPGEVVSLEKPDVDLGQGTIRIRRSETPAGRRILAFPPALRALLERRVQGAIGERLFTGQRGGTASLLNTLPDTHQRVLKTTKLAFTLYELRHTFATRLSLNGCPPSTLALILGHASMASIGRYVHPSQKDMNDAILRYSERSRFGFGAESISGDLSASGDAQDRSAKAGRNVNQEKQLG